MYSALEKTKAINKFQIRAIPKPRDLFARYGQRVNPSAIHSSDGMSNGTPFPETCAVISQVVAGQTALAEGIKKRQVDLDKLKNKNV